MVESLRRGHLGGAGLDTFASEPLAADHPLLGLENVILTPHIAGVTRNATIRVATITAQNVLDVVYGREVTPGNLINPAARCRVG